MKGFTLLELLVTVLIVGILASIAVPQYQRAVERSRASEAMTIGKAIVEAQNRSLDAYPNAPVNTREALDIALPGGTWDGNVYSTALFNYTLMNDGVAACRIQNSGCNYTLIFLNHNGVTASDRPITCEGNESFCAGIQTF